MAKGKRRNENHWRPYIETQIEVGMKVKRLKQKLSDLDTRMRNLRNQWQREEKSDGSA